MLLSHEPLLNRQRRISATRLVVHVDAGVASPTHMAAEELNRLADAWPSERTVLVAFSGFAPDLGLLDWQVPENAMVEIPAGRLGAAPTVELMRALQENGISLCIGGYTPQVVLPQNIQARFLLAQQYAAPAPKGAPGLVIAVNPPDNAGFENCLKNNYDGAAGWFFLNAMPAKPKALAPAHAQLVRLLNLVRNNAEVKDIEAALKQDVAISFKLLRYINSAGFGLSCEIQSFRHAVTILGYEKLHRWLSLLLVTASKDASAPGLMQASIARGRMMELAGKSYFDKSDLDNLFITGAFSVLDVLLGAPMDEILEQMHLPEAITETLLQGEGIYAPFLELAKACEGSDARRLAEQAETLKLRPEAVNRAQLSALAFADALQFD
jgi:EAL and modified HD-GYP domain-containing signal transduction protein